MIRYFHIAATLMRQLPVTFSSVMAHFTCQCSLPHAAGVVTNISSYCMRNKIVNEALSQKCNLAGFNIHLITPLHILIIVSSFISLTVDCTVNNLKAELILTSTNYRVAFLIPSQLTALLVQFSERHHMRSQSTDEFDVLLRSLGALYTRNNCLCTMFLKNIQFAICRFFTATQTWQ